MTPFRSIIVAALAAATMPTPLFAQAVVQPLGQTDADLIAAQMRQLASNPRDVQALVTAGELSIKLGDLSGAASLLARADQVDPRNGRVKAGMGSILVRSERPGEALRFFMQAESYGWPAARFAADRGLAYDLIGQGERAQRDYRLALRNGRDDETVRRYALSLGIAGKQTQALDQLDPLVRRQDRAAWRARAFVLAMNGDNAGAAKIATAMMPAAMGQGLGAFFQRLPTLSAIDRAFAVHFGEIYETPERLADARLTPALAPLAPEPGMTSAPVQVAAVAPASTRGDRRRGDRNARAAQAATRPVAAPGRTPPSSTTPTPVRVAESRTTTQPLPRYTTPVATQVAAASPSAPPVSQFASPVRESSGRVPASRVQVAAAPVSPAFTPAATPTRVTPAPLSPVPVATVPAPRSSVRPVGTTPVQVAPSRAAPVQVAANAALAPVPVAPVESAAATDRADSVLARIVASLSIPASELGIAPVRPAPVPASAAVPVAVARTPASPAGKRVVAEASAKEARDVAVRRVVATTLTGDPDADEPAAPARRTRSGRKPDEALADAKPEPKQSAAAKKKAAADKKAAAEKKELADKAAAEKKAARANPPRIWVQVAGGANERDLGKAWSAAKAKAPALASRTGYSAPLRATNRVLTGPFKTDGEARTLINQLAKQGISAFSFTSEPGQEVTRLGGK